jgi:hypothetical protein
VPRLDESPEFHLADRLLSVAESRSLQALGAACCLTMGELTGSPTVGLYLLKNEEPSLLYTSTFRAVSSTTIKPDL